MMRLTEEENTTTQITTTSCSESTTYLSKNSFGRHLFSLYQNEESNNSHLNLPPLLGKYYLKCFASNKELCWDQCYTRIPIQQKCLLSAELEEKMHRLESNLQSVRKELVQNL